MKRGLFISAIFLILILPLVLSIEDNSTLDTQTIEQSKVSQAYSCLEKQINDIGCSKLSPTQKIFALMATGKCKDEVVSDSNAELCWPKSNCQLKTTAQAIMALTRISEPTDVAEDWLLDQNATPSDVDWFLQIETSEESDCEIKYSTGGTYDIKSRADKKLSGTGGSCLSLSSGGWWYRISPSCYNTEFEIKCDKAFLTNLLFKDKSSSTIHISEKTSSTSAEGTTKEKVNSLCLKQDGKCDYEGTLWASVALESVGYDITSFMPYLITGVEKYPKLLPESLLYLQTNYDEFRNTILQKQKYNKYWDESGDKFYDTALALFPFQYSGSQQKANTIGWLLEIQGKDGCWDGGNVLSNSFLLYSLWPKQVDSTTTKKDCEDSGFSCMSEIKCNGNVLSGYSCPSGLFICCDKAEIFDICKEQGGEICSSTENCIGGTIVEASDTQSRELCCVNGRCDKELEKNECDLAGGTCRSFQCTSEEQTSASSCGDDSVCCIVVQKTGIVWWIWLLIILIILTALAILFREKLKILWYSLKSKSSKGGFSSSGYKPSPRFPPSGAPFRGMPQRKILPPQMALATRKPNSPPRTSGDLDDVLKRLKEIGK